MLISINWVQDFVTLPDVSPEQLALQFTLATAEVEGVNSTNQHLSKMQVVEISEITSHPEADKLNLVTFKLTEDGSKTMQVVCGAPNVEVGLKVPYAPLGTELPNGLVLEPKKIRGILSSGMLCSAEECGLSNDHSGLMSLPKDTPIGQSMLDVLNSKTDTVLDIDNKSLTHRPDLWGHYGIAREMAAIYNQTLKNPWDDNWANKVLSHFNDAPAPVKISMQEPCSCRAYYGFSVRGIKIEPSPNWMQQRLLAVGLKPINNLVDISNYVMLELGIPNHIFDANRIEGRELVIKQLAEDITFNTLDDISRKLQKGDTVISDKAGPSVLAGIMGGETSSVIDSTQEIFVEVANWNPSEVRRVSSRLGLRTDSSQRYEKNLDSLALKRTSLRLLELIIELCPNSEVVGPLLELGPEVANPKPELYINLSAEKINKRLGVDLSAEKIIEILESLDFSLDLQDSELPEWKIKVPSFRATKDIEIAEDIIEEIGRMVGYDNIEPKAPHMPLTPVRLEPAHHFARKVRQFLSTHNQAFEMMTYPMVGENIYNNCGLSSANTLKLINSMTIEQAFMRDSMIPSLIEAVSKNVKHHSQCRLFELGRTYHPADDGSEFSKERSMLGIAYYNHECSVFMDLLNGIEPMLNALSLPYSFIDKNAKFPSLVVEPNWEGLHPTEYYDLKIMGKCQGSVFSVHPMILKAFKIKGHVSLCIIDISDLEQRPYRSKVKYKPLAKFPGSQFDCSVVALKSQPVADIIQVVKRIKQKQIQDVSVLDIYSIDENTQSVTIRSVLSDSKQTLTGEVIQDLEQQIVKTLDKAGYPLR